VATVLVTPDGIPVITARRRVQEICIECGREFPALQIGPVGAAEPRCRECLVDQVGADFVVADGLLTVFARYLAIP
jgi:hypothetical protein